MQDVNSPDVYETSDLPEDEQQCRPPVSMINNINLTVLLGSMLVVTLQ